jgi:hypothetical protein
MARQIIVKGTTSQIAEIRAFLATFGEDGIPGPTTNVATMRSIPLSSTATSLILEQLQPILQGSGQNVRIVAPQSTTSPSPTSPSIAPPSTTTPPARVEPATDVDALIDDTFEKEFQDFINTLPMTRMMRIAEQPILAQVAGFGNPPLAFPLQEQPEVTIMVTPGGIVLSGNDPEALDRVEAIIRMLSDESILRGIVLRRYELKYAPHRSCRPRCRH